MPIFARLYQKIKNKITTTQLTSMVLRLILTFLIFTSVSTLIAQPDPTENAILDSIYIAEVEELKEIDKVLHAEPLFIDLIRDLGARKGEKEWNVGFGINPRKDYDQYESLVEYEWAPIDRLGLEIELPFSFYFPSNGSASSPRNKLNSVKLAAQWSFFVSQKYSTSLALGYLHEFELNTFNNYGKERLFTGNVLNPFFVAAKRWGNNFHTLIYTGPLLLQEYGHSGHEFQWEAHTNFHYMISGTRNFVGLEVNKYFAPSGPDITLRPQMRLGITDQLMLGIVTGIALGDRDERISMFLRLIYEPKHQ
jgi:hypothetical protein